MNTIMNAIFRAGAVALAFAVLSCGQSPREEVAKGVNGQSPKYRLIYNNDGTYVLGNALYGGRPLTVKDAQSYVDMVAGTPVTTYAICSNSLMPYYKSAYDRSMGCLGEGQKDTGETAHAENISRYGENLRTLEEQGTDIVEICVDRTKELGMEAFITMRMNDLHFTDTSVRNPLEQSDFWLNHPEYYVGVYPGWHADGALNFAEEEVREYKLNMIRELCTLVNLDGLELDFMRFPVYFPHGKGRGYSDVMTGFVAEARNIATEAGARRGRPILLGVRVPPDPDFCREIGFDIRSWIDNNLIDLITVSAFFTDDTALEIREFMQMFGGASIPIYGSMDNGVYQPREPRTHGLYRASATHLYAQGVDGLYLFNYFFEDPGLINTKKAVPKAGERVCFSPDPALLNDISNPERLAGRNKLYSLGDNRPNEYGLTFDSKTPVTLRRGEDTELSLMLYEQFGSLKPGECLLFLRMEKGPELAVSMNGNALRPVDAAEKVRAFRRDKGLKDNEEVQVYSVPGGILKEGENVITASLRNGSSAILVRLELAVGYGSPEQYGYF